MGSVLIESRLVGKLIGPRGATIQQLQSEYNVHISISKEDDAVSYAYLEIFSKHLEQWRDIFFSQEGNRTADIRGSDEDVQSAIAAIQERFCNGGGGGGGGYRGNNDRRGGGDGGFQGRSYHQGGGGGYQQSHGKQPYNTSIKKIIFNFISLFNIIEGGYQRRDDGNNWGGRGQQRQPEGQGGGW